jgi:hypothetical protein
MLVLGFSVSAPAPFVAAMPLVQENARLYAAPRLAKGCQTKAVKASGSGISTIKLVFIKASSKLKKCNKVHNYPQS